MGMNKPFLGQDRVDPMVRIDRVVYYSFTLLGGEKEE